ncbi:MAG TPA: ligand-gated channel, partial [Hyphomonas atlantica]|nr:ligand-gated channel [Hyphomonas atlantica]
MNHTIRKNTLLGATAIVTAIAFSTPALAQDASGSDDAEFLGTLTLGESKREVQADTATPVTVIDQEEIDDRQASTVAELIDSVPGVSLVNGSTPVGSGINIRGFGANGTYGTDQKVAIQIDGASVGSEELYRVGTQLFTDPYLYKSVEVIRGTVGSFEYGSGIIGGVVRLETIDASDLTGGEPGFALRQTLGGATNMDGFNSSTTLAIQPTENFEVLANYSWREQHNQEDGHDRVIENSEFELPSYLVKARYSAGDHSVTASYTNTETTERDKPYDSFGTTGGSFGNVDRDTTSETIALKYNYNPLTNDLINLDVIYSYANQEIDQTCIVGSG